MLASIKHTGSLSLKRKYVGAGIKAFVSTNTRNSYYFVFSILLSVVDLFGGALAVYVPSIILYHRRSERLKILAD